MENSIPLEGFQFANDDVPLPEEPAPSEEGREPKEEKAYVSVFLDGHTVAYLPLSPEKGETGFLATDKGEFTKFRLSSVGEPQGTVEENRVVGDGTVFLAVRERELSIDIRGEQAERMDELPKLDVKLDLRKYTVLSSGQGLYSVYPWFPGCTEKDTVCVGSAIELEVGFFRSFSTPENEGIRCFLGEKGLELQVGRVVKLLPYAGRDPMMLKEHFMSLLEKALPSIREKTNRMPHVVIADDAIDEILETACRITQGLPHYRIQCKDNPRLMAGIYERLKKEPERYQNITKPKDGSIMLRPGPELYASTSLDDTIGDYIMGIVTEELQKNGKEKDVVRCAVRYLSQGFGGYTDIGHDGSIVDAWRFETSHADEQNLTDYEQRFLDKIFFEDMNFRMAFEACEYQLTSAMEENNSSLFLLNASIADRRADDLSTSLAEKGVMLKGMFMGKKKPNPAEAFARHYASIAVSDERIPMDSASRMKQENVRCLAIAEAMIREGYNDISVKKALRDCGVYAKCYARPRAIREYCSGVCHEAMQRIQKKKAVLR